jgi:membrane-associated phospholipid phosphatase
MNWPLLIIQLAACAALLLAERAGLKTTLELHFKGDVKRETRWLAQYGQSVCTPIAALLVYQLDPGDWRQRAARGTLIIAGVLATSVLTMLLKRTLGRVRPGRENAGKFLGPTLKHANYRESFPSSHSACAVALSVLLSILYPAAAPTFWGLAVICAALRYLLDAHWPSDVLGGVALGYTLAHAAHAVYLRSGYAY